MIFTVQNNSLKQLIADEIKRRIIYGELELGQKISENSFAQELGTKRTPVREAFILLQGEGLVSIAPQKGTYVFKLTEDEIAQIGEHRFILEYASLQSLQKKDIKQRFIDEIADIIRQHKEALEADDMLQCEKYDSIFHERIIDYSANKYIISSYKIISDMAKAIRFRTLRTQERFQNVLGRHEEIFRLFVEGDMKRCESVLRHHIDNILHRVISEPLLYERVLQKSFPAKKDVLEQTSA
jgi:DNA-binding GntR family transcriptional regulator